MTLDDLFDQLQALLLQAKESGLTHEEIADQLALVGTLHSEDAPEEGA